MAYSDLDFVLLDPQKAISAPLEDAEYLRAISLFLNSSVGRYLTFFHLIRWGIDRNEFSPAEVEDIPLPRLSAEEVLELGQIHRELAALQTESSLFEGEAKPVWSEAQIRQKIDEEVERALNVPDYLGIIARDFVQVRLALNHGVRSSVASQRASVEELKLYATYLREILDGFGRGRVHHQIEIAQDADFTVCTVEIHRGQGHIEPRIQTADAPLTDSMLWDSLARQESQWVYVQRSLRVFEGRRVHLWKTSRLLDWTRTQALVDSDTIKIEVLTSKTRVTNEVNQ